MKGEDLLSVRSVLFDGASGRLGAYVRLANWLKERGRRRLANLVYRRLERRYGIFISIDAEVPVSTRFPHPTGIVIGRGVRLGESVTIFQNVTLGGRRQGDGGFNNYPTLGDFVIVYAGAAVLGRVNIGHHSVIGANAVVLDDVLPASVATGIPATSRLIGELSHGCENGSI